MDYKQHINPVYAIGAIVLIGGFLGSYLWEKAENIGTEFDLESRIAASEGALAKDKATESKTTSRTTSSGTGTLTTTYDTDGAILVRYTNDGFVPTTINARLRQVIRFRNDSTSAMRVAPAVSASDTERYNDNLEQERTVGKGGSFDFGITRAGVFPFTNLNNPIHIGLLVVTP